MGRGPSPRDPVLFHLDKVPALSEACLDLCYLFSRGFPEAAALQLVGNRFQLRERQRLAVLRCAANPLELAERKQRCVTELSGAHLVIDGFNLVILLEAASGGGVLLQGTDGCVRDLSSIHGNYRLVSQTAEMICQIGEWMEAQEVASAEWWFDAPVSNSGRLVTLVRELADERGWQWQAQTSPHVDQVVAATGQVAVSSDKIILRECQQWANLGRSLVEALTPDAWMIQLPQEEQVASLEAMAAIDGLFTAPQARRKVSEPSEADVGKESPSPKTS